jgi:hypothetical protein
LIADSPDETDYTKCIVVNLPTGAVRTALNLMDNPENLKKQLAIRGVLRTYFGIAGMRDIPATSTNWILDGDGPEPPQPPDGDGDGSKESPYSVEQGRFFQNGDTAWVIGYIVGSVKDGVSSISSADDVFIGVSSGFNLRTNILIADSPDETDYTKCIVVNLPTGAVRTALNLMDNPGNLKKQLAIRGVLRTYFGIAGMRDIPATSTNWILDGGGQ